MIIYAGSLPFKMKEKDLKALFENYGTVTSATIIIDKVTRQNKGYGFVEMPNENEANKAIKALHHTEVMDRKIIVSRSEQKKKPVVKKELIKRSGFSKPEERIDDFSFKKKLLEKKRIPKVTFGDDESGKKKKIKSARRHKHPWQKR